MRKILSNSIAIHLFFLLGMFALFGYIATSMTFLLFFVALSFGGALCGSFIKTIDEIRAGRN